MRRSAPQKRRAFVDLIERIGHQNAGAGLPREHGLTEGKQRFASAVYRQDLCLRIQFGTETTMNPMADGRPQFVAAAGRWIGGQATPDRMFVGERRNHEIRGIMFRFADRKRHARMGGIWCQAGQQRLQSLEGIRLQAIDVRVH